MSVLFIRDNTTDELDIWRIESRSPEFNTITGHQFEKNDDGFEDENGNKYDEGSEIYSVLDSIFNRTLPHSHIKLPIMCDSKMAIDYIEFTY